MILKHKTTSKMVEKLFLVIEKRIAKNNNTNLLKIEQLETAL